MRNEETIQKLITAPERRITKYEVCFRLILTAGMRWGGRLRHAVMGHCLAPERTAHLAQCSEAEGPVDSGKRAEDVRRSAGCISIERALKTDSNLAEGERVEESAVCRGRRGISVIRL